MELIQQISKMIEPILEEYDCYEDEIVYEQENNEWYLRIFIEKNNDSLDMDTCVAVSEKISEKLDLEDPIKGEYYLEVSSPGAERPLRNEEELKAAIGSYVHLSFYQNVEGEKFLEGTLLSVGEETVTLNVQIKTRTKEFTIERKNIAKARLAIKF